MKMEHLKCGNPEGDYYLKDGYYQFCIYADYDRGEAERLKGMWERFEKSGKWHLFYCRESMRYEVWHISKARVWNLDAVVC